MSRPGPSLNFIIFSYTKYLSSTPSLTLFFLIRIIFSVYENFVNDENSFLNQKHSDTRILISESMPTMRNPLSTQIVTHTQIVTPFSGLTKSWLFGGYSVLMTQWMNLRNFNISQCDLSYYCKKGWITLVSWKSGFFLTSYFL